MADVRQYAGGGVEAQQREANPGAYQQALYTHIAAPPTPEAAFQQAQQEQRDLIGRQLQNQLRGVAQMPRAPGKLFTRSDVLAIIRGQHGVAPNFHAKEALDGLARIFENLE